MFIIGYQFNFDPYLHDPYTHTLTHTHTDRYISKSMRGWGGAGGGGVKISQYLLLLGFLSQNCMNQLHTHTQMHTFYIFKLN